MSARPSRRGLTLKNLLVIRLLSFAGPRAAFSGFIVSGFLFALPGALLPVWDFHLSSAYAVAGTFFLMLVSGLVIASALARHVFPRYSIRHVLFTGAAIATTVLFGMALLPVNANVAWRMAGMLLLGFAAGAINRGLFQALLPFYDAEPAKVITAAGICFGAGSLTASLLVAMTYAPDSYLPSLLLAFVPLTYALYSARTSLPTDPGDQPVWIHAARQWRTLGAVVFALLLFFQFANEWSIAGWLPLYLIARLGLSPAKALWLLGLYWFALTTGRVAMTYVTRLLRPSRVLFGSATSALFGCLILVMTDNPFGAVMGILFLGGGFASIYPLVAARIGKRFPDYHPGFFNGVFSLALTGGMLAPWMLGLLAAQHGMRVVILMPALGTCMVVMLLLVLWLESRVTGR